MIAVYCGKAAESWLAPEWIGLVGVISGALIGFGGNFLLQRFVLKRTALIESNKLRASFITQHVLKEVLDFIDAEIKYLHELSTLPGPEIPSQLGRHRGSIGKIETMLGLFNDPDLEMEFWELMGQDNDLERMVISQDMAKASDVLFKALEIATEIKRRLVAAI
ncbi:hypothetical protein [Serratia fonticola]